MFQSPTSITLWEYPKDVLDAIFSNWWKLWMLDYIAKNENLREKLKWVWIIISSGLNPIIVWNNQFISEDEYKKIINQNQKISKIRNGIEYLSWWDLLIRVSAPWDFRSLVDIFPTESVDGISLDWINQSIVKIKQKISLVSEPIKKYASWTWVEYNQDQLTFWVVTKMDIPIVTVTEDPNSDSIFIDEFEEENFFWKTIYTETDSENNKTRNWEKVRKFLKILREEWILDKKIAYQLELWSLYDWNMVLFQIKEFANKVPLITSTKWLIKNYANRIISWKDYWNFSLPIIYWQFMQQWFSKSYDTWNDKELCLAIWYNASKLLPQYYLENIVWFIHWDAHGWVFNHNSFRMAQAVVQRWWIAILWNRFAENVKFLGFNNFWCELNVNFYDWEMEASISSETPAFKSLKELPHPDTL